MISNHHDLYIKYVVGPNLELSFINLRNYIARIVIYAFLAEIPNILLPKTLCG